MCVTQKTKVLNAKNHSIREKRGTMGKIIGVMSLKGGVGKTSVVVALGSAISDFGKKVLLIDGNLSSPTLGLHLNIINPKQTIHHVLNRAANTKDAIYE